MRKTVTVGLLSVFITASSAVGSPGVERAGAADVAVRSQVADALALVDQERGELASTLAMLATDRDDADADAQDARRQYASFAVVAYRRSASETIALPGDGDEVVTQVRHRLLSASAARDLKQRLDDAVRALDALDSEIAAGRDRLGALDDERAQLQARLYRIDHPPAPAQPAATGPGPTGRWDRVQAAIADIPYPVSRLNIQVILGDMPGLGRHWGVYDPNNKVVYIGDGAFASNAILKYTVSHEFAHAYFYHDAAVDEAAQALVAGGPADPSELIADCLARYWGATAVWHYWLCPDSTVMDIGRLVR